VSGDWRAKTEYARMMLHQASGGMSGQAADMRRAMEEMNEISRIIEEIYLRHTKIPPDKLQEILDRDTFIRGELALKWHLIDKIVEARKNEFTKEEGNV
jgi:ATP-dependent Clp protease protease subunit